jgi:putative oxidoreductase
MKNLFSTNPENVSALVARLALGFVIFPHSAQKLLGWFGGHGFKHEMSFLTSTAGFSLPWIVALLVILIEFFGSLLLIVGLATRFAAFCISALFVGVVISTHTYTGFFMNWQSLPKQPEGSEYFILLFGLAIITLIIGGGKASVDSIIAKNISKE